MKRIKRNDMAYVTTGVDRGKTGRVLRVLDEKDRIVIEGVNMVYKHVRRSQQNPQGGRIQKENPMAISNVMVYCEKCQKGVRVRFAEQDGKKTRVCAKCSEPFPT